MLFTTSIKKNRQFVYLYKRAASVFDGCLVVYYAPNKLLGNRIGITVSKKVGNAVVRNKIRRRIRESYLINENSFKRGYDIIIVARVRAATVNFQDIRNSLLKNSKKAGLVI